MFGTITTLRYVRTPRNYDMYGHHGITICTDITELRYLRNHNPHGITFSTELRCYYA